MEVDIRFLNISPQLSGNFIQAVLISCIEWAPLNPWQNYFVNHSPFFIFTVKDRQVTPMTGSNNVSIVITINGINNGLEIITSVY